MMSSSRLCSYQVRHQHLAAFGNCEGQLQSSSTTPREDIARKCCEKTNVATESRLESAGGYQNIIRNAATCFLNLGCVCARASPAGCSTNVSDKYQDHNRPSRSPAEQGRCQTDCHIHSHDNDSRWGIHILVCRQWVEQLLSN